VSDDAYVRKQRHNLTVSEIGDLFWDEARECLAVPLASPQNCEPAKASLGTL